MIRSALIAIGLSAGAASAVLFGATAARAQGVVRAAPIVEVRVAPIVEVCTVARAEQADVCGAREVASAPVAPRDVAHTRDADLPVGTQGAVSPMGDAVTPVTMTAAMHLSLRCGAVPFHRNAVFQDTMNGSDPSADFCP